MSQSATAPPSTGPIVLGPDPIKPATNGIAPAPSVDTTAVSTPTAPSSTRLPELPKPSESTQSKAELDQSTDNIRNQLLRLQVDDIAQIAAVRKYERQGPLSDQVEYWKLFVFNVKRYAGYLWLTWSSFIYGVTSGRFNVGEAVSVFTFGAWTSSALFMVFLVCTIGNAPILVWLWEKVFGPKSNHLSLVNASNPHIFQCLTDNQVEVAKTKMGSAPDPSASNPRNFDLDIAKFLLQIASLMYERDTQNVHCSINTAIQREALRVRAPQDTAGKPGAASESLYSLDDIKQITNALVVNDDQCDRVVRDFCKRYQIEHAVASELQTTSQAYCSLFWDPKSTWIIVAFKGTDPISFDEWATDFTGTFADCSGDIDGFKYVHSGFKDRLLPDDTQQPYDKIAAAIKIVSDELVKGHPAGTKINLWFTGHSLGTALASIAYAKALIHPSTLGDNALLRDGYIFATPITVDIRSRLYFSWKMRQDPKVPRTLWRVTNRNDFVATGVPQFGDDRLSGSFGLEESNFDFCHLGVEIYMKNHPDPCQMAGDAIRYPDGFAVNIVSHFTRAQSQKMRGHLKRIGYVQAPYVGWAQYIPFIGSFVAHATTNYWEQLEEIGTLGAIERQ